MIHINSEFFKQFGFRFVFHSTLIFGLSVCLHQPFMSPRYPGGPRPPLRIPNQVRCMCYLKFLKRSWKYQNITSSVNPHFLLLLVMCNLREGRVARLCAELAFCEVLLECRSTYIPSCFVHDCLHTCRDSRSHTVRGLQPCSIYYLCSSRK